MATNVQISNQIFSEILMEVGYPVLDKTDLEIPEDTIKDVLIWQAMKVFWTFFPIPVEQEFSIGGTFDIDFPNDNTFSVIDARLNTVLGGGATTSNPFINSWNYQIASSSMWGTPYNYNMQQAYRMERWEKQSITEDNRAFRVKTDEMNRKLKGYTTQTGKLSVIWAEWSYNWSDIPFRWQVDVTKLAKANVLRAFGQLRGQMNTESPTSFNYEMFINKADDYTEEVMKKFYEFTKVAIQRG